MNTAPTTYAIRVDGHLDDHWSARLGDVDLNRDDDGTTTLTVSNADQAQLHGVLVCLRDIGAVITELRVTDAPISTDGRDDLQTATAGSPEPIRQRPTQRPNPESGFQDDRRSPARRRAGAVTFVVELDDQCEEPAFGVGLADRVSQSAGRPG